MVTARQLDRIGMGRQDAMLPSELLEGRAEDCSWLQNLLAGSDVLPAAYAILRATELGQAYRPLVQQAVARLLQLQQPDGSWPGDGPSATAVCVRVLAEQGAWAREATSRGLFFLERRQLADGSFGVGTQWKLPSVEVTALVSGMLATLPSPPTEMVRAALGALHRAALVRQPGSAALVDWACRQAGRLMERADGERGVSVTSRQQPAVNGNSALPARRVVRRVPSYRQGTLWPVAVRPAAAGGA